MIKVGDQITSEHVSGVVVGLESPKGDACIVLDPRGVMHEVLYREIEEVMINSPKLH